MVEGKSITEYNANLSISKKIIKILNKILNHN